MIASFNSQGPSKRELSQAREISQSSSLHVLKDILWLVKEIQKNLGTPWALRGISCLIHHYSFWLNSSKTFPWPSFLSHDLNLCSQNPDLNLYHSTNYLLISWMPFPWLYSVLLEWTDYASLVFIVFPLINIIWHRIQKIYCNCIWPICLHFLKTEYVFGPFFITAT